MEGRENYSDLMSNINEKLLIFFHFFLKDDICLKAKDIESAEIGKMRIQERKDIR